MVLSYLIILAMIVVFHLLVILTCSCIQVGVKHVELIYLAIFHDQNQVTKLGNYEDILSFQSRILSTDISASQKAFYLSNIPPISFHIARKPLT